MATEYKVWADITNPDATQVGTQIGTQISASSSAALWWYLDKAGVVLAAPDESPTSGQGWPR